MPRAKSWLGTQFTCFTSTQVQILTPKLVCSSAASAAKWFGRVGACSGNGQVRVALGESEMAALSTAVEQAVQKRREEEEARRQAAAEAEAAAAAEAKAAQGAAAAKKRAVVEMEAMLQKLREEAEVSERAAEEANFAAQQAAARKKALEDEEVSAVLKKLQDDAEDAELAAARAQSKAKESKQVVKLSTCFTGTHTRSTNTDVDLPRRRLWRR
jgi:hypothetical protein